MSTDRIHPTAIVAPGAQIADDVRVGPYSIIDSDVKIGAGSVIEAFVRIKDGTTIGARAHIYENTIIGSEPQDHDFGGERSFVRIGDDVTLRENITINRATGEGNETVIGDGCLIMESCHLAHNVRMGREVTVTNKVGFSGHVEIGDYAVIGGMSGFHQFVHIGAYAMVGGMSKVTRDIPPYTMTDGNPARVRGLNVVGLRRRGFSQEQRSRIKNMYRMLYDTALPISDALAALEREHAGDEQCEMILSFVRSLKRGLTKWLE